MKSTEKSGKKSNVSNKDSQNILDFDEEFGLPTPIISSPVKISSQK